jgi:hypothetical protein
VLGETQLLSVCEAGVYSCPFERFSIYNNPNSTLFFPVKMNQILATGHQQATRKAFAVYLKINQRRSTKAVGRKRRYLLKNC